MRARSGDRNYVVVGRICGLFGVRGWVRIHSYTDPRDNLLRYEPWYIAAGAGSWQRISHGGGRQHGSGLIVSLEGVQDREQARAILGRPIAVHRRQLPEIRSGEFYWCDLIGLQVFDTAGRGLGRVTSMRETGANDVLVVEGRGRLLIPFVHGSVVRRVNLEAGRLEVDWNPEYL